MGHLEMILRGFPIEMPSFRDLDPDSQRVGIELYLWPIDEGTLLEIYILPYMELLNRTEIYGLSGSDAESVTDWYLCEKIWEELLPQMESEFKLEHIRVRG
jgi:hypothetical protein